MESQRTELSSVRRPHRLDITGLRAIAVSFVLLFHYFPNTFPAGFLGVDLFFVVSGFVIMRAVLNSTNTSLFEAMVNFYANRIRRIAPALFVMFLLVLVISPLFMTKPGGELARTGAYSLIGLSNFYLFHIQAEYFGLKASQNPYTHTWSLGVEEQFYLFFPILFFTLRKFFKYSYLRILFISCFCIILISLIVNVVISNNAPSASFYLPPARIWEIAAGAFTMILLTRGSLKFTSNSAIYLGVLAITLCTLIFHPISNWQSQVILVSSTSLLLYLNETGVHRSPLNSRPLVWLGNCSFSVYLVHWPLLVASNYILESSYIKNLIFSVFSIFLGWVLYRFVETPFRVGRFKTGPKKTLVIGLTILTLTSFGVLKYSPVYAQSYSDIFPRLLKIDNVPEWTDYKCSAWVNVKKLKDPIADCLGRNATDTKKVLYLIGDSHAVQFIPMIQKSIFSKRFELKYLNMEKKIDFPFAEFKPHNYSASLKQIIQSAKSGDYVVLAFHRGHLNSLRDQHLDLRSEVPFTARAVNLENNLSSFARILQKRDVNIILISDTPLMNSEQSAQSCAMQIKLFGQSACKISRIQDLHTRSLQDRVFEYVEKKNQNVLRWDPLPLIYKRSSSFDVLDSKGHYLMYDSNHITPFTASFLVHYFNKLIRN